MTARVPLYHRGEVVAWALVDDDRHDELAARRWTLARSGYAYGSLNGRPHPMHREVVGLKPGEGKVVHHANEDKLDNRRANLEVYADASDHLRAEHPLSYRRRIDALRRTIAADPCWGMRIEKRIALERVNLTPATRGTA